MCGELLLLLLSLLFLLELILPVCVGQHARVVEVEAVGVQIHRLVAVVAARPTQLLWFRLILTRLCGHILLLSLLVYIFGLLLRLGLSLGLLLLLLLLHRDFLLEPLLTKAHVRLLWRPGSVRVGVRMDVRVLLLLLLLLNEWRIGVRSRIVGWCCC